MSETVRYGLRTGENESITTPSSRRIGLGPKYADCTAAARGRYVHGTVELLEIIALVTEKEAVNNFCLDTNKLSMLRPLYFDVAYYRWQTYQVSFKFQFSRF